MGFLTIDPATVDPNIIYLALVFSMWIGVTAAYMPGTIIIEVIAGIGLFGTLVVLAQLPTNWLAVLVLVVGVCGFIIMPFIKQQYAALAVVGLALQAAGGFFLFTNDFTVSPFIIVLTVIIPLAYHQWVLMPMMVKAGEPALAREEQIIGMQGRVVKDLDPIGTVNVHSELWTATSDKKLKAGDVVVVVDRVGLQLIVEKVKQKNREEA